MTRSRTLARYPAALSVSTPRASSSRRDKGQLNETVRGAFGLGHVGRGRAAWGGVSLGICIPDSTHDASLGSIVNRPEASRNPECRKGIIGQCDDSRA